MINADDNADDNADVTTKRKGNDGPNGPPIESKCHKFPFLRLWNPSEGNVSTFQYQIVMKMEMEMYISKKYLVFLH